MRHQLGSSMSLPITTETFGGQTLSQFDYFHLLFNRKRNLIVFELFIYIKIWNLEAHQPLKTLPCRSPSAFPWPGLLLPARQSWKVSPWAPNTELKPWMLPGHKLRPWMHSNWIFILSILWKNSYNLRYKNSSIHEPRCERSLCHRCRVCVS